MKIDPENIVAAIGRLRTQTLALDGIAADLDGSRAEFFSRSGGGGTEPRAVARHLEWFLLERVSPPLGGIPVQEVGDGEDPEMEMTLRSSLVGIFEITGLGGEGVWLRDLAGFGEYPISGMDAAEALAEGDLIVGRLFPLGDGSHHLSSTAGHYRDEELRTALRRDLERARERGGSKVLRLGQADLESLFWSASMKGSTGDPLAEAWACLRAGGLGDDSVLEILHRLEAEPFDAVSLLAGSQGVVGDILDELAFDSDLDLGEARRCLLAVWRGAGPASEAGKGLAASAGGSGAEVAGLGEADLREARLRADPGAAVADLRGALDAGGDPEQLYRQLEERLGLSDGASPLEGETPAPDFPGAVGALVEEFLWETGRDVGAEAAERYGILRMLGRFGGDIGVVDNLTARDLLRFCALWVPENDEVRNGDEGRQLLSALGRFCRWCEEEQGLSLRADFADSLRELGQSLPRIAEANRRRTRYGEEERGELLEVVAAEDGHLRLRGAGEGEEEAELAPELCEWIAAGDYVRGTILGDGRVAVYCSYPPQVGPLLV